MKFLTNVSLLGSTCRGTPRSPWTLTKNCLPMVGRQCLHPAPAQRATRTVVIAISRSKPPQMPLQSTRSHVDARSVTILSALQTCGEFITARNYIVLFSTRRSATPPQLLSCYISTGPPNEWSKSGPCSPGLTVRIHSRASQLNVK